MAKHLLVTNEVEDFEHWRKGFEAHRPSRLEAGLLRERVFRGDGRRFYVLFEVADEAAARRFIESPALREHKRGLGVHVEPRYDWVDLAHSAETAVRARVESAFAAVDRMASAEFASHFAPRGEFRFAIQPPAVGPAAVEAYVRGFFGAIAGLRHRVERLTVDGQAAHVIGTVDYRRKDGSTCVLPFANYFELDPSLRFTRWQISMDVAPLFQPPAG